MKTKPSSQKKQSTTNRANNPIPATNTRSVWSPRLPLRIKRILVPIDFSDPCSKALRYAVGFAEQFGAVLSLVHVLELDPYVNRLLNQLPGSLERDMAKQAEETLAALAQAEIHELIPVRHHVRVGKPYQEIVALAKSLKFDLIIMPTQGLTGLKHAVIGSTAERVVRHAPCPVLVVRAKEREFIN